VLERAIYRGVIEQKQTKKRDAWGRKKITTRPDWHDAQALDRLL